MGAPGDGQRGWGGQCRCWCGGWRPGAESGGHAHTEWHHLHERHLWHWQCRLLRQRWGGGGRWRQHPHLCCCPGELLWGAAAGAGGRWRRRLQRCLCWLWGQWRARGAELWRRPHSHCTRGGLCAGGGGHWQWPGICWGAWHCLCGLRCSKAQVAVERAVLCRSVWLGVPASAPCPGCQHSRQRHPGHCVAGAVCWAAGHCQRSGAPAAPACPASAGEGPHWRWQGLCAHCGSGGVCCAGGGAEPWRPSAQRRHCCRPHHCRGLPQPLPARPGH